MISARGLTKKYDSFTALNGIDLDIQENCAFGLVGSNGAGKSTFFKLASGVLKPDNGSIRIDGVEPFEHPEVKRRFFYVSDNRSYSPGSFPSEIMRFYKGMYPGFDDARYFRLMEEFALPAERRLSTYSKGMCRLLSFIFALSAGTGYIFLDETLDGLDPVMRQAAKELIKKDIKERGITAVISSHNLKEIEGICGHIGLLHEGEVLLSRDMTDMELNVHKFQCVFGDDRTADHDAPAGRDGQKISVLTREYTGTDAKTARAKDHACCNEDNSVAAAGSGHTEIPEVSKNPAFLPVIPKDIPSVQILGNEWRGSMLTVTARGERNLIEGAIRAMEPVFYEELPLTLEDVFTIKASLSGLVDGRTKCAQTPGH